MNIWKAHEYYDYDFSNEIKIGDIIKFDRLPDEIVLSKLDNEEFITSATTDNQFFIAGYSEGHIIEYR